MQLYGACSFVPGFCLSEQYVMSTEIYPGCCADQGFILIFVENHCVIDTICLAIYLLMGI